ncbi:unnamed protein product [Gongylonema pulchrum]|uniref:Uncharacterized protein n=1 Tax=Gongylonema pulchrum TaxID=637853 RepID=A0A3P6NQZ9_9BILA|nr:unnamed protein product [Gongylonema pulchrum]
MLSAHFSAVAGASRENLRTRPSQAGLIHHDVIHEDSKADLPVGRHPVSGDPPPSFESGAAQKHLAARTATWQSRYRHKLYKRQSRLETHIAAVHEKLALKSSKSSGSQILPATAVHNQ